MPPRRSHLRPSLTLAALPGGIAAGQCRSPERHRRDVRRRRAPGTRWELAGAHGCSVRPCARLLDALEDLPRETWAEVGRQVAAAQAGDATTASIAALDALLAARCLGATAWYVRDAVETAAHLAPRRRSATTAGRDRWCRVPDGAADRVLIAAARQALGHAALALLVRPWLAPDHFRALAAPAGLLDCGINVS